MSKKHKRHKVKKVKIPPKPKRKVRRRVKPTQRNSFVGSKKKQISKPDRRQLKVVYRSILVASPEARVAGLIAAVHWYDKATAWVQQDEKKKEKLTTTEALKGLDSIENLRQMSFNTQIEKDKEPLLRQLLEQYESIFKGVIKTRPISSVYEKLSGIQDKLEKRETRMVAKYQKIVTLLQDALRPENYRQEPVLLKVVDISKAKQMSTDLRSLLYSRSYAKEMTTLYKRDGLLPLVNQEINTLALMGGHQPDKDQPKGFKVLLDRKNALRDQMMKSLVEFCQANPKLSKKLVKVRRRKRTKKEKT